MNKVRITTRPPARTAPRARALHTRVQGTGFTDDERAALGLRGFLPAAVEAIDTQLLREIAAIRSRSTPLERYLHMSELQDRSEALFFRLLIDNITELMPIVYTPVVGEACLRFSQIYRRPRGLFLSYKDRGSIASILKVHCRGVDERLGP